jgi:tRNA U38,U39,U40 pseudouridine synthase TruA
MFQGVKCFKNLVKIDTREPDPMGYIRNVESIKVSEVDEQSLLYCDSSLSKTLYIEIKAKAFMWG